VSPGMPSASSYFLPKERTSIRSSYTSYTGDLYLLLVRRGLANCRCVVQGRRTLSLQGPLLFLGANVFIPVDVQMLMRNENRLEV